MFAKVINPKKDGKGKGRYDNSGSCITLVNYLDKEDKEKGPDRELYFTHDKDMVLSVDVISAIDKNCPKIGKDEAKFYSLVIAPRPEEMEHIKNDKKKLKQITREFMDIYAANFNGKNGKGKNLKGSDLVYFAKLEENRYYKGTDIEVKEGRAKQGDPLPGDNTHIHVIVSRMDKTKTIKLSPLANSKSLFSREDFKRKCCRHFDQHYKYEGSGVELEKHIITRDGTIEQRKAFILEQYEKLKTRREELAKQRESGKDTKKEQVVEQTPGKQKVSKEQKVREPQKQKNKVFALLSTLIYSLLNRVRGKSKAQEVPKKEEQKKDKGRGLSL